ncbi:MAG: class I tRNA ligase family protein, partial [Gammaproteobacteria bacterium]|nr:class I tRNA ligase family protein [Gammaproteobacteria bacterium]
MSSTTQTNKRKIVVTSALPYANGPVHIGHMVEYTQTDIWVRYQKLQGNECIYVCADDAHGTPIMLSAQKAGISPQELIDKMKLEHEADFADFEIGFDNFHSTHSEENKYFATYIYNQVKAAGHIATRT